MMKNYCFVNASLLTTYDETIDSYDFTMGFEDFADGTSELELGYELAKFTERVEASRIAIGLPEYHAVGRPRLTPAERHNRLSADAKKLLDIVRAREGIQLRGCIMEVKFDNSDSDGLPPTYVFEYEPDNNY